MIKQIKDLTFEEYKKYCNLRACDGNWGIGMALTCVTFLRDTPNRKLFERRKKYKARCEKHFKNNLHLLFNLEEYPNMKIDIETGKIEALENE